MSKMFCQCRALTELDLSAWNIKKEGETKINMEQMFYMGTNDKFGKLKTIYVGENWDPTYIGSSSNMFFNCTELVGGNNTVYNASCVDGTYACVDTPSKDGNPAVPGYLTYKATADATT
jgi:surface protein